MSEGEGRCGPGGGEPEAGEGAVGGEPARLQSNKNREVQLARTGGRRLFKGKARRDFLRWFAATGNVVWSAAKAGFDDSTIWRHRMDDPRFAEAFDRAFEQSVARNKAKMLERRARAKPIAIDGGVGEAELDDCDPDKAWPLIVEIERAKGRGGSPVGRPPRAGRAPRVASNKEVREALEKRLRAFGRRVRGGGTAPPTPSPRPSRAPGTEEESAVPGTKEESVVPGTGGSGAPREGEP
ncbi:MAG TPA: hypothetical protein VEA60_16230 [Allosphingosinicella sp.]|nr:hypothetical protein [Allosphingosinicella sp.]